LVEGRYYLLPVWRVPGLKVGLYHHLGETGHPDALPRDVTAEDEAVLRRCIARYFPDADGPVMALHACLFTNTPDEHFVIDALPGAEDVLVISACSGHGFKFCPVIGEIVADLVTAGRSRFDLSMFRLGRFRALRGADLLHKPGHVDDVPVLRHLAVAVADEVHDPDSGSLSGWRRAEERSGVGAGEGLVGGDEVSLRDHVNDLGVMVGKGLADRAENGLHAIGSVGQAGQPRMIDEGRMHEVRDTVEMTLALQGLDEVLLARLVRLSAVGCHCLHGSSSRVGFGQAPTCASRPFPPV
jgi:hypothetical protein